MQQRRLRLGDILDDYCPRERRITNHAVVAMIEDEVKQTRCSTCDADHEYKQARVPVRRKKDGSVLVLDAAAGSRPRAAAAMAADIDDAVHDDLLPADDFADVASSPDMSDDVPVLHAAHGDADDPMLDDEPAMDDDDEQPRELEEDGPVHRRLIRATLPRPDGPSQEWKEPDFTVRQSSGNGNFDGNRGGFDGNRPGHRPGGGPGGGAGAGGGRGPRRGGRPQQGSGGGQGPQVRFGAPRQGGGSGRPSGQPQGHNGNRPGRPGMPGGQGQGQNPSRGQRPGGGPGRKRGR